MAILLKKDQKEKVRVIEITLNKAGESYIIKRFSGLFNGKMTKQPDITILSGKVKRTIEEQANLQYNSEVKKYLDKGYVTLESLGFKNLDELDEDKVPNVVTDTNGALKPMLCIAYDKVDKSFFDRELWISRKHDGVRCMLRWDGNKVITSSRGGTDYDIAAKYICEDPFIIDLFKKNPELILDGEIYRHGWPLNKISGLCRLDNNVEDHKELKFHCYDLVDESKTFSERLKILQGINPPPDSKLVIVEHLKAKGFDAIMKLHNQFVEDGYEGAVARIPDAKYKCGARSKNYMIKFKVFKDDCFKVVDIIPGLRPIEDMVFVLETKDGKRFNAKPIGDRAQREEYFNNFETKYKNQIGELKFFYYSEDGIPQLPVFRAFRFDIND